jgi:uncharacterized protein (DUF885 family)
MTAGRPRGTVAAAALLAVSLAACGGPSETRRAEMAARVDSLADATLAHLFTTQPELATRLGVRGADHGRIRDNSPVALLANQQREDELLRVALTIDPDHLAGRPQWVSYAVLREHLEAARGLRACQFELWGVASYVNGWQAVYTDLAGIQPVGSEQERAQAIARVRALPRFLDQEILNLRAGLQLGYSAPRVIVSNVLRQLDDILATPVRRSPFFSPAQRNPTPVFAFELERVIRDELNPAIRRYRDFLASDYLPAARESLGVSGHPDGAACYAATLRSFASVAVAPDSVFETGLREIDRIRAEMETIVARSFAGESLATFLPKLTTDPRYTFRTSAEVIDSAEATVARGKAAMDQWFGRLPLADLVVQPYPEFRQRAGAPGQYEAAPEDGSRPAIFLINPSNPTRIARAFSEALAVHEGIPGHHLQVAITRERGDLHPINRYLRNSGFGEGWGLYAERLADEMGLYSGDLARLGLLGSEAMRAARMVVDVGIHTRGWSRDTALAFFRQHAMLPEATLQGEIDRYISWPGQAPSYMIGRNEILGLREEARHALGEQFDIKLFHDRVLEDGTVPLAALRTKIVAWVAGGGG